MSQYFSFQWHITDECDQRCKASIVIYFQVKAAKSLRV